MKLAVLFSGGKDSTFALYNALRQGNEIKYLVTAISENPDSWMFHTSAIDITRLQSEALGIPRITFPTKGIKEKELDDLKSTLEKIKPEIEGVVSGAIASDYQRSRIEKICSDLNLRHISPIWHTNVYDYLKELVRLGFEIIFTSVSSMGFEEGWLGRRIDEECISDLKKLSEKYGINPGGEGGEYETAVVDCPIFSKKIVIKNFRKIWDKNTFCGKIVDIEAVLEPKK